MQATETNHAKAERISRVIFEHASRISREQRTDALLRLNADLARDLVAADRCTIWLVDANSRELWTKVAHGLGHIRIPFGRGIVGACVELDHWIVVNDVGADERFFREVDTFTGYRTLTVLVVPLRADGKVIGALEALNKPGGFSDADVELLGLSASYSASAIQAQLLRQEAEAARLMVHELEIARDVQRRLLPQELPELPGVEYAASCRSAKYVGGDYYDFLALPEGLFAFTLGDVSGKGISAAVMMASIQALLRGQLLRGPLPLASLMNEMNLAVFRSSTPERYSTLFCGVLNADRTRLTFVNAGHPPPMLVRACPDGKPARVHGTAEGGLPIGLFESARYEQFTIDTAPGDLIVCFSDGVSDATNSPQEVWEDTNIERVLWQYREAPVEEIVERIVQAADSFTAGAEQFDDMTLTAVRIT